MSFYNLQHLFFIHTVGELFKDFLNGEIRIFPQEILMDFGGVKFHVPSSAWVIESEFDCIIWRGSRIYGFIPIDATMDGFRGFV